MNFEIHKKEDESLKYTVINLEKDCYKKIKQTVAEIQAFEIDANALGIYNKLYTEGGKKGSYELQKANCKNMIALYKLCIKIVKLLRRKHINFSRKFYVENLDKKINNNDFMLASMLNVRFNFGIFKRVGATYKYAADYLDMENSMNNMCDFRDNKCTKHRELNDGRTTGCCSKTICKYTCNAPCPTWNLACKIIMCDYLIKSKGYYFSPHTTPIIKVNFTYIERLFSIGQLCCASKKAIRELWIVRLFTGLVGLSILGMLGLLFFVVL